MSADTELWSTPDQRTAWKQEAEAEIAPLADAKQAEFDAYMRRLCADTEASEPPDYSGMWK